MADILCVSNPDRARLDVVFIHGLDGNPLASWTSRNGNWPRWVALDHPDVAVWSVGYGAASSAWKGQSLSVVDRATNLLAEFEARGIGRRPLCAITHSMGGLIYKEMVLQACEGPINRELATFTAGVVYLSTPHNGSALAKIVRRINFVYRGNAAVGDLESDSAHLRDATFKYREWAAQSAVPHLVFFETKRTHMLMVVGPGSSDPGLPGVRPIPVDENHKDICKPHDRSTMVYQRTHQFIAQSKAALDDRQIDERPAAHDPSATSVILRQASVRYRAGLVPDILIPVERSDLVAELDTMPFPRVVLGEGGLGKSVLAGQIFDAEQGKRPCLLAPATRIPTVAALATTADLDAAFGALFIDSEHPLSDLVQRFEEPPLVIIDTLDLLLNETNADSISAFIDLLSARADVVITCREQEWDDLLAYMRVTQPPVWRLPHLRPSEVLAWAQTFLDHVENPLSREALEEKLTGAVAQPKTLDVLAVPLRLAMVCKLYAEDTALPADLTTSRLYREYWERRVHRDRRGLATDESLRTEEAALLVASRVWDASSKRFVEDVQRLEPAYATERRQLLSEGVLKEIGLRTSFFHQTFAEFAVSRTLSARAETSDLRRLAAGLRVGRSGYWAITGHLVTEPMSADRLDLVTQHIPRDSVDGVRLLLRACFAHSDPTPATHLFGALVAERPNLVIDSADVLAEAPHTLNERAIAAVIDLSRSANSGLTALVGSGANLIVDATGGTAATALTALLDVLASRCEQEAMRVSPEIQRLITAVLEDAGADSERLLSAATSRYPVLPRAGRTALLQHAAQKCGTRNASAGAPAGQSAAQLADQRVKSCQDSINTLLDTALRYELPNKSEDDATVLLLHAWSQPSQRTKRNWTTWFDLLTANVPRRWDTALVRSFQTLATDDTVARELAETLLGPPGDHQQSLDRLNNAAKYAADTNPTVMLNVLLGGSLDANPWSVASASQLARHCERHLVGAQRNAVVSLLMNNAHEHPNKAWPSILHLAGPDHELLRDAVAVLLTMVATDDSTDWKSVIHKSFDGLLQTTSAAHLATLSDQLDNLIQAVGGLDAARYGRLQGALTPASPRARSEVDRIVDRSAGNQLEAIRQVAERIDEWPTAELQEVGLPWLGELLRARGHAVVILAGALHAHVLNAGWTPTLSARVVERLIAQLDNDEDTQGPLSLARVVRPDRTRTDQRPRLRARTDRVQRDRRGTPTGVGAWCTRRTSRPQHTGSGPTRRRVLRADADANRCRGRGPVGGRVHHARP